MEEIWKDVDGFEKLYQVSNFGRIKSLSRIVNTSYGKTIGGFTWKYFDNG